MATTEALRDSTEQLWHTEQFDPLQPFVGTTWDDVNIPQDFDNDVSEDLYDFGHVHKTTSLPSANPNYLWSSAFEPAGFDDGAEASPENVLVDPNLTSDHLVPFSTLEDFSFVSQAVIENSPLATLVPSSWRPAVRDEKHEFPAKIDTLTEIEAPRKPTQSSKARRKSSTTKANIKPYNFESEKKTKAVTRKPVESSFRACWRCKKYRKPCDANTVCNGCLMTSGFRVWPSTLGCKRGNMHEFAYLIIPTTSSDSLKQMNFDYVKPFSWRQLPLSYGQELTVIKTDPGGDIWDRIIHVISSTYIHGPGIIELLEICSRFQRKQRKPQPALREAALSLYTVVELYHNLVSTSLSEPFDTKIDIEKKFVEVRKSLIAAMDKYVHSCLTGKLKAWPPTLLTCSLLVLTYVYLADAVAALPWLVRTNAWADVKTMVINLRNGLYVMARDLLLALAKGVRMLDMECWNYDDASGLKIRNSQGMKMMDDDESAFDTMVDLIEWRERFLNLLNGDIWLSTTPFDIDLLPVMSLARLFNVSAVAKTSS